MEESEPPTQEEVQETVTLMKPKRTRTVTEEQRKALAENMRKVNQARIEKAKLANEKILQEKEAKVQAKLETIKAKKETIRKIKEEMPTPPPPSPKAPKRRVKKVILQEENDTEDDTEEEEEIVYIQKAKAKPKDKLLKSRSQSLPPPEKAPVKKELPPYSFKFV